MANGGGADPRWQPPGARDAGAAEATGGERAAVDADEGYDVEELAYAANGDGVATKLDLARAYFEMGDEGGARGMLEGVLRDGSEAQRKEARSLLESIGRSIA